MQRTRSIAASDEWHLVGQSEDEGSVRSMSQAGASRPQTPAVSLHFEQHALELGSECPPTPESERLADTVLCAPFGGNGTREPSPRPARSANSSVDACGAEVVSVRCLQGLSQEGPLEGFAARTGPNPPTADSEDHDLRADDRADAAEAAVESDLMSEAGEGIAGLEEACVDEAGWQGLDETHIAGVDAMMDFLESLGWSGSMLVDACRASLSAAQEALTRVQQTTSRVAASARQSAHTQLSTVLAYVAQLQGKGSPATGLLVSALSLTTLATLAGLIYFMGRCRHLKIALDQRDREYARLVSRVLNLQAALSQNMSTPVPVLRHTSTLLSSLVTSSIA